MPEPLEHTLSRRERQIMDVLFARDTATAAEVRGGMPDPPSYSAVRAQLRILEDKGHVKHEQDGPRYLYRPTVTKERAARSALHRLVDTFFNGSVQQAVAALLEVSSGGPSEDELDRLQELIQHARSREK